MQRVEERRKKAGRRNEASEIGRTVYEDLRRRILLGEFQAGQRIWSAREIQQRYGVPYRAARFALRRLERDGRVTCRIGAGTYVVEEICDGPPPRGRSIEVLFDGTGGSVESSFYTPLVESLREELVERGADCTVVGGLNDDSARDRMSESDAAAFVWVAPRLEPEPPPPPEAPLVVVAHNIEPLWLRETGYDVVAADHVQGGALAGKYLRERGCRQVAVLAAAGARGALRPHIVAARRIEGFERGWGGPVGERLLVTSYSVPHEGAAAVKRFLALRPRPDAVFAASDDLAMGFCHGLIAHGLGPGLDVRVVGFDGQPLRYDGEPPLTTVEVALSEMGCVAARLATERAADPDAPARRVHVACRLRRGETA